MSNTQYRVCLDLYNEDKVSFMHLPHGLLTEFFARLYAKV